MFYFAAVLPHSTFQGSQEVDRLRLFFFTQFESSGWEMYF